MQHVQEDRLEKDREDPHAVLIGGFDLDRRNDLLPGPQEALTVLAVAHIQSSVEKNQRLDLASLEQRKYFCRKI